MEISGKAALVTGAGTGIGRASSLLLAERGVKCVVVVDVDREGGEETAALVKDAGAESLFLEIDVGDRVALAAGFAAAADRFGGLDIVHNNAGLVSGNPPWPGTSLETIERVVQVNVMGTMFGTRLAIEHLGSHGGGVVVNTASVAGLAPMPTDAVYAATKAAVILFTQSCKELAASTGVRVNAVLPGIVDTSMVRKTGDGVTPAVWLEPALGMIIPLHPAMVAAAVVALVEDDTRAGHTEVLINEFRQ